MDLRLIQNVLAGRSEIAQWQITERRSRRFERYLTFLKPESEREASSVRWQVWIALPPNPDGTQGEAGFTVTPVHGGPDLRTLLAAAITSAASAPNRAWKLPGPGDTGAAAGWRGGVVACNVAGGAATGAQMATATDFLADQQITRDPGQALNANLALFSDAVHAAPWTRPSAIELFASIDDRRLVNHRGLDLSERRTRCYAEFVLLHRGANGEESEYYDRCEAASLGELRLAERVADAADCLRDGAAAGPPPAGRLPVLIGGEYLAGLMGWYAAHADAAQHVRNIAALTLDAPVVEPCGGDRLNLSSDAIVPSLAAYRFDEHGYAACRQDFIQDGVLTALHGAGRWMQVLERQPRGQLATLVAPPGRHGVAELRHGSLEVVRFSEFHPRHDTGAFSGEIRFGWWNAPDGSRIAVKGGSVSGVLREAMTGASFSREVATVGGWHGPEFLRLHATVAV